MILLPHHIEGGNGQGAFAKITHQRVNLGGEAEPAFELFLAELAGFAHKEVARLLMVLARHDDEGKQPVKPHIGQEVLAESAQLHQHPRADIEPQNGAPQYHAFHSLRAELGQMANKDGAKGDADKVGAADIEMIEQPNDIFGHFSKAVVALDHLLQLVGLTVAAQVQQQHVEVLAIGAQLLEPDGGAATGTVDKHHPIPLGTQFESLVIQHPIGSLGDGGILGCAHINRTGPPIDMRLT